MIEVDDDVAYEVIQHTYAAIMWLYRYLNDHNLTFEKKDRVDILDYHIDRIDALLAEVECPIANDPTRHIVSDLRDRFTRRRQDYLSVFILVLVISTTVHASPNGLLQAPKVHVPNVDVTLPYVR